MSCMLSMRCQCGTDYRGTTFESVMEQQKNCPKCAEKAAMEQRMESANMFARSDARPIPAICDDLKPHLDTPLGDIVERAAQYQDARLHSLNAANIDGDLGMNPRIGTGQA